MLTTKCYCHLWVSTATIVTNAYGHVTGYWNRHTQQSAELLPVLASLPSKSACILWSIFWSKPTNMSTPLITFMKTIMMVFNFIFWVSCEFYLLDLILFHCLVFSFGFVLCYYCFLMSFRPNRIIFSFSSVFFNDLMIYI